MPTVDLAFRLRGKTIPADHGYALYAAVSRIIPAVHAAGSAPPTSPWRSFGIHPINGVLTAERQLTLTPASRLIFRLNSDLIRDLLPLAGKELSLDGSRLTVGVPMTYALKPAAILYSRLVTIKHRLEPESFLEAAREELSNLGIKGNPGLVRRQGKKPLEGKTGIDPVRSPFTRRTIRIHNREVVGYALVVANLASDESILLQEHGLGGRRRFGCGIFVPRRS